MRLEPLLLSAKRKTWRMDDGDHEKADTKFRDVRTKVIDRDRNTCRFCGFCAKKWQEVHHRDDNHANNDPANLITACIFCHLCHHVGRAGLMNEAILVWLPEFSQADLHHIARACFVAMREPKTGPTAGIAEAATDLWSAMREREEQAERRLGTSRPEILAQALIELPDDLYDKRDRLLSGIRLLPMGVRTTERGDVFEQIVSSWRGQEGPYFGCPPQTWGKLVHDAAELFG